jgi:hypothetical protein
MPAAAADAVATNARRVSSEASGFSGIESGAVKGARILDGERSVTQATVGTQLASLSRPGARGIDAAIRDMILEDRAVGLIEFDDTDGIRWRVWHVETPPARAHLMDPFFRNGWLVFEREDGSERRRLSQVPEDWAALDPGHLAQLCAVAVPVMAGRTGTTGPQAAWPRPDPGARSGE